MLDYNTALSLMKKYGYTSTSVHPYIYKTDTFVGICYTFIDDFYGTLERVAIFRTEKEMDDFLKKYQWFKVHGAEHNVTMKLDDYDKVSPNIIYLRNGIVMAADEMFNLDKYDSLREQKQDLVEVDKYILEASNLVDIYNSIKDEQIAYARSVDGLLEQQRGKYIELQLLVDRYNGVNIERKKLEVEKRNELAGINIDMERAIKERLSQYKSNLPDKKEAMSFIRDIWNLCLALELNDKYFQNVVEENTINNDILLADKKTSFMNDLLSKQSKVKVFKKNLPKLFNKIDLEFETEKKVIDAAGIQEMKNKINKKYSYFNDLDILKLNEYLNDAKLMDNYEEIKNKYTVDANKVEENIILKYDEVIADLKEKYAKLPIIEQNSLILYFSSFGRVLNSIMMIPNFKELSIEELVTKLNADKKYLDLKDKYYYKLKNAVLNPANAQYKKSVFATYDFSTEESFIKSCIDTINVLIGIKSMELISDTDVYFVANDYENFSYPVIVDTTTSIAVINGTEKASTAKSVLATIYKNSPVLYCDRYIDFGSTGEVGVLNMQIREENSIAFAAPNMTFNKEDKDIIVSKYSSKPVPYEGISIVDKLYVDLKSTFCNVKLGKK